MITHAQQTEAPTNKQSARTDSGWAAGIGLVAIGALLLVAQFVNSEFTGMLILPALALIFLIWGMVTRTFGLIIPGGICAGLGVGTWLVASDWAEQNLSGEAKGGLFLMVFALGWALITVLSVFVAEKVHWWPLIPAAVMALIGTPLLIGGTAVQALVWLGYIWPLALVAVGLFLLLRRASEPR